VAVLAGLLPECRDNHDAKHLTKLLESLQIESNRCAYCDCELYAQLLPIDLARGRQRAAKTAALTDQKQSLPVNCSGVGNDANYNHLP
jgi:hypothetical protein